MQFRTILFTALIGFFTGWLGTQVGKPGRIYAQPAPQKITAQEFDVVDANGNTLIRLYQSDGAPAILMNTTPGTNPSGQVIVNVSGAAFSRTDTKQSPSPFTATFSTSGIVLHSSTGTTIEDASFLQNNLPVLEIRTLSRDGTGHVSDHNVHLNSDSLEYIQGTTTVAKFPAGSVTPAH